MIRLLQRTSSRELYFIYFTGNLYTIENEILASPTLQTEKRVVSRASPSPHEGRVWSTSHHGFVSVCHDFLGVLTTNDAHRRVVARAVHAY